MRGACRGELEGTVPHPHLPCSPSFIFSAPSAKRVMQMGAGMLRSRALPSGPSPCEGQGICRCSPKMSFLQFNPLCAGRAASAAVALLYWRTQQRGGCGLGGHRGGSRWVGVLPLCQGFPWVHPPARALPGPGGSSPGQHVELRRGGGVCVLSFAPKLIFPRQVRKHQG